MRLAFAADLHGNLSLYRELLAFAVRMDAQAVVIGGDLCPHEPRLAHVIATQHSFLTQSVRPVFAEFRSQHPDLSIWTIPGNDDWAAAVVPALAELEQAELLTNIHGRSLELAPGLAITGYACVPPTPFSIKDYERPDQGSARGVSFGLAYQSVGQAIEPLSQVAFYQRPSIAEELAALVQQSNPACTIYVCHTPPAQTPLDMMRGNRHVGSPALRSMIERHQPLLTLHGHIHEAPALSGQYACQIGPSWCVNPGRDSQQLHAVLIDTDSIQESLTHTIYGRWNPMGSR